MNRCFGTRINLFSDGSAKLDAHPIRRRHRLTDNRYQAHGSQAEFEPGSRRRVLCNRLGITRVRDIHRAESEALLDVQEWAVGHFRASHRFTKADIVLLHRHWLGRIYPWAGQYRQVNVV